MVVLLAACSGGGSTPEDSTGHIATSTTRVLATTSPAPPPPTTSTTTSTSPPLLGGQWEIPPGEAPVIDGIQTAAEWSAATEVVMSDGSQVYAMHADGVLYLAVSTGHVGAINVAIATGSEVWILHSSAALGSARYLPGAADWELAHGFTWCCRSADDESERLALLEDEGWQANNGFTGDPGVVEYQIALSWAGAGLAVASITDSPSQAFWPADLSADARSQLVGSRPLEVAFRLSEWYTAVPLAP
jgi:hypothetical protein